MTEEWRDIPDYEGYYQASNLGRIRSVERTIRQGFGRWDQDEIDRIMPPKLLTPWAASTPDRRPIVSLSRDGIVKKRGVHILVALAFVGPKPNPKSQCCHRDGDPHNNTPGNLYWGDNSTNVRDAIRHGTNYQTSKATCPYGHELRPPNLRMGYFARYGNRACRACSNAYMWAARRGIHGADDPRKISYADKRYQELMACSS